MTMNCQAMVAKLLCGFFLILGVADWAWGAKWPVVVVIPGMKADGLDIPDQTLTLVEKNGWLVASLVAAPDKLQQELEWEIVLAKLKPDLEPVVTVHPQLPLFSVQYGTWFVRESLGRLRVYREPKNQADSDWVVLQKAPEGATPCTAGGLFVVEDNDWCWVCTSPTHDRQTIDTRIRFQHVGLKHGHGSMMFADGRFGEVFCGDAKCHDEGDLLVAERISAYGARALLAAQDIKDKLIGQELPQISGKRIGNTYSAITGTTNDKSELSVDVEQLHGKVVLVDFWATWCGPCVAHLPEMNQLQAKYRDQGLVVIGVHASQTLDDVEGYLNEHPVQFPVVVADEATEERFAVSVYPTYFLVGRDGKVVLGFRNSAPTEEHILAELNKEPSPE